MLGIVINPKSGKKAFRQQRLYLWKLLKKRHQPFTYRITKYAGHATELGRELVEKGYDQILVLGGDGTLSEVISGIMTANITEEQRRNVQFGLMPRGTGNDFARFWGLDRRFKRSLQLFFDGQTQPMDVGCLTYWRNNVEQRRYFINSAGFGVDSLTNKYGNELKYYIGSHHVNYLFGLFYALFAIKPVKVNVYADDKLVIENKKMYHANFSNGPYNGGGMKQCKDGDPRDGIFNAIFVEPPTMKQVFIALKVLFNGDLNTLPFVYTFSGKDFRVEAKDRINTETDGLNLDFMGSFEVHCLNHAIGMTVPPYCEMGKEIHDFPQA